MTEITKEEYEKALEMLEKLRKEMFEIQLKIAHKPKREGIEELLKEYNVVKNKYREFLKIKIYYESKERGIKL